MKPRMYIWVIQETYSKTSPHYLNNGTGILRLTSFKTNICSHVEKVLLRTIWWLYNKAIMWQVHPPNQLNLMIRNKLKFLVSYKSLICVMFSFILFLNMVLSQSNKWIIGKEETKAKGTWNTEIYHRREASRRGSICSGMWQQQ